MFVAVPVKNQLCIISPITSATSPPLAPPIPNTNAGVRIMAIGGGTAAKLGAIPNPNAVEYTVNPETKPTLASTDNDKNEILSASNAVDAVVDGGVTVLA